MPSTITEMSLTNETELQVPTLSKPLPSLSEEFEIADTLYGGRGCFATTKITQGSVVLRCERPFGFAITRDFKKEVCAWCFQYDNGRTMKSKIISKNGKFSINFCSDDCCNEFKLYDNSSLLTNALLSIEKLDVVDTVSEVVPLSLTEEDIANEWRNMEIWENQLPTKLTKREKFKPSHIDEAIYDELKFLATVLFELYQDSNADTVFFDQLQSNENEKIIKYPQLLQTYTKTFQMLKVIMPLEFQPFITTKFVRSTLGKESGNAFGIWSPQINDEYQEYLGFGLYPPASLFNHSCSPNLKKIRDKANIKFVAIRDIEIGEEMYINYGSTTELDFTVRQSALNEWFFHCACKRCTLEEKLTM